MEMLRTLFKMIMNELYHGELKMYQYNTIWEIPVEIKNWTLVL